jgi:BirA family biotin operon repressor/biotin-[acetyl-CoA-carboxylase] ligase
MRQKILEALYRSKNYVSGETLSKRLGISRVAIWKHIQTLRKEGYVIESSTKGYRLVSSPDLLLPEELPDLGVRVYHFKEITSTMDVARKLAPKEKEVIVIAETQTKGRGRLGRYWHSAKGGIYFSLILRPKISPLQAHLVNLMAGIAVAKTIRNLFNLKAMLKWPNDVLIDEKKVCGILAEMEAEADIVKFINLGIGINANNEVSYYEKSAISLKEVLGKEISRKELFLQVLREIKKREAFLGSPELINEWKQLSSTFNHQVRIITPTGTIEGQPIDIDDEGALILRTREGNLKRIVAGDCVHLR